MALIFFLFYCLKLLYSSAHSADDLGDLLNWLMLSFFLGGQSHFWGPLFSPGPPLLAPMAPNNQWIWKHRHWKHRQKLYLYVITCTNFKTYQELQPFLLLFSSSIFAPAAFRHSLKALDIYSLLEPHFTEFSQIYSGSEHVLFLSPDHSGCRGINQTGSPRAA